jgi:hypothetical protein
MGLSYAGDRVRGPGEGWSRLRDPGSHWPPPRREEAIMCTQSAAPCVRARTPTPKKIQRVENGSRPPEAYEIEAGSRSDGGPPVHDFVSDSALSAGLCRHRWRRGFAASPGRL